MSTDFYAVCDTCKVGTYLGARYTTRCVFGYAKDDDRTQEFSANFIVDHLDCGKPVYVERDVPDGYTEVEAPEC